MQLSHKPNLYKNLKYVFDISLSLKTDSKT